MRSPVLPAPYGSAKADVRRYAKDAASYPDGRPGSLLSLFRERLVAATHLRRGRGDDR